MGVSGELIDIERTKEETQTLEQRREFIMCNKEGKNKKIKCDADSVEGSVSQRACVYCGARVVLNPITDAFHIVHGPIGCASYTWDIRGSLSSGEEIYRNSFSTDLEETDIVFGGEKKLAAAIDEICKKYNPKLIFVYSTCVVGVIGDDVEAVCKAASQRYGISVIPVYSPGFSGNKSTGYKAACNALLRLIDQEKNNNMKITPNENPNIDNNYPLTINKNKSGHKFKINYLGDFNLAAEIWIITDYLKKIGVEINSKFTGDSSYEELIKAPQASLNIVQCAGSMVYLAKMMEEKYDIPFVKVSFFGVEDTGRSLRLIAKMTGDAAIEAATEEFIKEQEKAVEYKLDFYRKKLKGKKAAIYVGGGFKAISLIKQFADLNVRTVMVGTQTGKAEDYEVIKEISEPGTIILDDANPTELENFMREGEADILVGGVKERPLSYKMGIAFCDHNHERKHPLCGYIGALNFAEEIYESMCSPIWKTIKNNYVFDSGGEING